MTDVAAVVVTDYALPRLERCLASVQAVEAVVVDHGSTDGTVTFVRERFPGVAVVEEENRGLAFGWNTGLARVSGRSVLLLSGLFGRGGRGVAYREAASWLVSEPTVRLLA